MLQARKLVYLSVHGRQVATMAQEMRRVTMVAQGHRQVWAEAVTRPMALECRNFAYRCQMSNDERPQKHHHHCRYLLGHKDVFVSENETRTNILFALSKGVIFHLLCIQFTDIIFHFAEIPLQ